jgi:hypothetical protein
MSRWIETLIVVAVILLVIIAVKPFKGGRSSADDEE